MIGVKQQVIQMVQSLPENVTVDDVMAELYFKMQVDAGLKELDEGKGIPHEEVEKKDVQMAYKIRWSPRAASNFEEICDYIGKDSVFYASLFAKKVNVIIKTTENPEEPFIKTGIKTGTATIFKDICFSNML